MTGRPDTIHDRRDRREPVDEAGVVAPSRVMLVAIVLVAVAAVTYIAGLGSGSSDDSDTASTASVRSTPSAPADPSASPSATSSPSAKASAKAKASPSPAATTAAPAVQRAQVQVSVFNNSSTSGLGARTSAKVKGAGWKVLGTDNWYGTIPEPTVYYPASMQAAAKLLAKDVGIDRVKPAVTPMRSDRLTVIVTSDYAA